jgi:hypothetical protein
MSLRPLLTWFAPLCEAELKSRDGKKPPGGWVGVSHEVMLMDVMYHVGKLTKAAYDRNWAEFIRQCANCANEFAMMADNAQRQLDAQKMYDKGVPVVTEKAGPTSTKKPGGWSSGGY